MHVYIRKYVNKYICTETRYFALGAAVALPCIFIPAQQPIQFETEQSGIGSHVGDGVDDGSNRDNVDDDGNVIGDGGKGVPFGRSCVGLRVLCWRYTSNLTCPRVLFPRHCCRAF